MVKAWLESGVLDERANTTIRSSASRGRVCGWWRGNGRIMHVDKSENQVVGFRGHMGPDTRGGSADETLLQPQTAAPFGYSGRLPVRSLQIKLTPSLHGDHVRPYSCGGSRPRYFA